MNHTTKTLSYFLSFTILVLSILSCNKDSTYTPGADGSAPPQQQNVILKASGDIIDVLKQFRHFSGDSLNTQPDGVAAGRREINWDAVPVNFTNNGNFPADFFNATDPKASAARKRGLVLESGNGFRVDSSSFSELNNNYSDQFEAFSPKRIFTSIGTTVTTIKFKIPGTFIDAGVKSFGAVFLDVDLQHSTSVEFFEGIESLGVFDVPAKLGNKGLSFLGVYFPQHRITRIKIISGDGPLAPGVADVSAGGSKDLVVMDDFIYSEPQ